MPTSHAKPLPNLTQSFKKSCKLTNRKQRKHILLLWHILPCAETTLVKHAHTYQLLVPINPNVALGCHFRFVSAASLHHIQILIIYSVFPLVEVLKWRSVVPHANVIDECAKCCASTTKNQRLHQTLTARTPEQQGQLHSLREWHHSVH